MTMCSRVRVMCPPRSRTWSLITQRSKHHSEKTKLIKKNQFRHKANRKTRSQKWRKIYLSSQQCKMMCSRVVPEGTPSSAMMVICKHRAKKIWKVFQRLSNWKAKGWCKWREERNRPRLHQRAILATLTKIIRCRVIERYLRVANRKLTEIGIRRKNSKLISLRRSPKWKDKKRKWHRGRFKSRKSSSSTK